MLFLRTPLPPSSLFVTVSPLASYDCDYNESTTLRRSHLMSTEPIGGIEQQHALAPLAFGESDDSMLLLGTPLLSSPSFCDGCASCLGRKHALAPLPSHVDGIDRHEESDDRTPSRRLPPPANQETPFSPSVPPLLSLPLPQYDCRGGWTSPCELNLSQFYLKLSSPPYPNTSSL